MSGRARNLAIAAGLASLLVLIAVLVSQGSADDDSATPAEDTGDVQALFDGIDQRGIALGDPGAPITLTEYADPQCPFCAAYSEDALPEIVERYVRPGDVRLELNLLTFIGPDSESAARMAYAASLQDRMWQFTDLFYANQEAENSGYVTDDFLFEIAEATPGLDAERALADRESAAVDSLVEEAEASASKLGVESTPSFFAARGKERPAQLEVSSLTPEPFIEQLDALLAAPQP